MVRGSSTLSAGPREALCGFAEAVSTGAPRSAVSYLTRSACLITPDGTSVRGRESIGSILRQLREHQTEIELDLLVTREAGEVALATGRVRVRSLRPDGSRLIEDRDRSMVLQRVEGLWRLAVIAL